MSARETCWSQSSRYNVDSAQHAASGRCIVIVQYAIHHFNLTQLRQNSLSRRAREDVGETASADVISGKLLEGGGAPHNVDHAVATYCKVPKGIPAAAVNVCHACLADNLARGVERHAVEAVSVMLDIKVLALVPA